jgi:hypothetical protein
VRLGDGQIHDEIYRLLVREYGQASCFSFAVMGATVAGAVIGGAIASVSPGIADPGAVVVITMGASALIAYGFKLARSRPDLSAEDIRRLMPLFHFDEGETAYLEALLALAENPYLQEETAKQIIADLNRLLDTYYQLQKQREQLQEAMGTASESEMETLQQRLAEDERRAGKESVAGEHRPAPPPPAQPKRAEQPSPAHGSPSGAHLADAEEPARVAFPLEAGAPESGRVRHRRLATAPA